MHTPQKKYLYVETYGCQMNFSDSEIVASILQPNGFEMTQDIGTADVIFLNTCSIRDHAEQRVKKRLQQVWFHKKKRPEVIIGLLGCMADRTKTVIQEEEQWIDLIAGPDAYRDLPKLLEQVAGGHQGINTQLSYEETYADITPVRLNSNGISAFISIMRGCENYCSYCVVPSTRGRERSRDAASIIREATMLFDKGFREVTLLGQNVNSYQWPGSHFTSPFASLLEQVAAIDPALRIRFATSHPKDISDDLLHTIATHPNICKAIHLPVQSGSTPILQRMKRNYTREQYMERIEAIRHIIPGCGLSTDIITGFCGETEEDHRQTLSLMEWARFDHAFMFKYSERPLTFAAGHYPDDVPETVKERRLREIIDLQRHLSLRSNQQDQDQVFEVLSEGASKRSAEEMMGRTSHNKVVVFGKNTTKPGDYVMVRITGSTSATLRGRILP